MRLVNQLSEIFNCTESRIDGEIVLYIVTVIGVGLLERREPQYIDVQCIVQIIQIFNYALQIAHSVIIRIGKGRYKYLIADAIIFPTGCKRLLRIYIVISLIGNNIVLCYGRTVFDTVIWIEHDGRFVSRRTVLRFSLTDKPVIVSLFTARLIQLNIHVTAVIYPEPLFIQTAIMREHLYAEPRCCTICNSKPLVLPVYGIPSSIVVRFTQINVVHRARFIQLHGIECPAFTIGRQIFPNPKAPVSIHVGINGLVIGRGWRIIHHTVFIDVICAVQIMYIQVPRLAPCQAFFILRSDITGGDFPPLRVKRDIRRYRIFGKIPLIISVEPPGKFVPFPKVNGRFYRF